jgi:hypothetical protein
LLTRLDENVQSDALTPTLSPLAETVAEPSKSRQRGISSWTGK